MIDYKTGRVAGFRRVHGALTWMPIDKLVNLTTLLASELFMYIGKMFSAQKMKYLTRETFYSMMVFPCEPFHVKRVAVRLCTELNLRSAVLNPTHISESELKMVNVGMVCYSITKLILGVSDVLLFIHGTVA
jgi:hypothetical protein